MTETAKDHPWAFGDEIAPQPVAEGVSRKILM